MPSHCKNRLMLKGLRKDVKKFVDAHVTKDADGNTTLSYFDDSLNDREDNAAELLADEKHYYIDFTSDWYPQGLWIRDKSIVHPHLEFHLGWYNLFAHTYGYLRVCDAKKIYEERKYEMNDEDFVYYRDEGDETFNENEAEIMKGVGKFAKILGKVNWDYEKKL